MRAFVLCDDNWHPAHVVKEGLEPLRKYGYDFEYVLKTDADVQAELEERITNYPVLVIAKSNRISADREEPWITPQVEQAIHAYVNEGGSLLVIHSGTVGYKESAPMLELAGGVFNHHPEQCPVTIEPVDGHPISQGIQEFTIKDEHYFMDTTGGARDLFLVTRSEHGQQPGGWTKTQGSGRICVLTPGHNPEVWLHPEYQKLLRQSLDWCMRDQGSES